jgi:hypothetical protein
VRIVGGRGTVVVVGAGRAAALVAGDTGTVARGALASEHETLSPASGMRTASGHRGIGTVYCAQPPPSPPVDHDHVLWVWRALLFALAGLILVAAAAPADAMPVTAAASCGAACGASGATTAHHTGTTQSSAPCIRDAGCGGGGTLTAGSSSLLVALAVGGTGAIALAVRRVRRRRGRSPVSGALLAQRFFHPPRVLLGS